MLTNAQQALLEKLERRGGASEMFAPNRAVVNALVNREYVREQFLGQRWTFLQLTPRGEDALLESWCRLEEE